MPLNQTKFPEDSPVDYATLRPHLRDGDILICSGRGLFSTMIQQATNSIWSHVGLILRLETLDRVMLLESVEPAGVRTVRLSKYLTGYADDAPYQGGLAVIRHQAFTQRADPAALQTLARYAVDQFGHPYDKHDIARIAARIMSARVPFTREQQNRIKRNQEYICSEYVARCYETVGIHVPWNRKGFIAPADFAADPQFNLVSVLQSP